MSAAATDDPDRLRAVRALYLAASPAREEFDELTAVVADTLDVPISLVSLVDADLQCFLGQHGLGEPWASRRVTPLSHSVCQHCLGEARALQIDDARRDARLLGNLALPDLGVAAYLGVPLRLASGAILGSLCAIDTAPREWTAADVRRLEGFARLGALLFDKQVERRRRAEAEAELLQVVRSESSGRVAATFAHDVGNLLMGVRGRAELLAGGEDILALVDSAMRLTTDALGGRSSEGAPAPLALDRAVRSAEGMLRALAGERIALDLVTRPAAVALARGALEQVLANLVVNARDALRGAGRIAVEVAPVVVSERRDLATGALEPGEYALLTVSDDGPGMPPEVCARAFEPYFTTKTPGTGDRGGAGLGLYSISQIAEGAGAVIDVSSALGEGTTVSVYFPAVQTGLEAASRAPAPDRLPLAVLLVEDSPTIAEILSQQVEALGVPCRAVGSVARALAAASRAPISLVITDLRLPDGSGLELAGALVNADARVQVVAMSATPRPEALDALPPGRLLGYLRKPFALEALRALVREHKAYVSASDGA